MNALTAKEVGYVNGINTNTRRMGLGAIIQALIAQANNNAETGTPVNAVNATKSLEFTGVVIDSETVTFNNPAVAGTDVYEFLADTAQTKTAPTNIAVDITANTTKASRVLTVDTQPTNGDTMTIGTKVYHFVTDGTEAADGDISVGTDLATAQANIVAAINGSDRINTAHSLVTAGEFAANASTITALVGGVAGDSIATTETFTAGTNVFAGATLTGGADCTAANAITALVAAITASDTQGVGAADGAGDTIDITADTAGVVGNSIALGETLAHGAFAGGAVVLSGGIDGTVGALGETLVDDSYIYIAISTNTTAGKNWRRISIGVAY